MTEQTQVTVHLLEQNYQFKCPKSQAQDVQMAALLLDDKMKTIRTQGKLMDDKQVSLMAALNIAHEFLDLKNQQEQQIKSMGQRIKSLQRQVEATLNQQTEIEL
jgi:cell division protein ZapA